MTRLTSRRQFLGAGAASAVAWTGIVRSDDKTSANERVNLAFIGTQNQAAFSIEQCHGQNVVALCDVDSSYLRQRAAENPKARCYSDFRKLLDREHKSIDAVVVATPDHIHAPAAAMALRLGKHVYCEKPLTHTVAEARLLVDLAEKGRLATQMGTQIHAGDNYRRVVELIQSGAIGQVTEVHAWCGKGWSDGRFQPGKKAPANLDWDLWLGPAKKRPFSPHIHPADWRRFWDYGTGTLGDMACHVLDLPFWALKLDRPTSVAAKGPEVHPDGAPAWCTVEWGFPARESMPALKMTWADGDKRPGVIAKIKAEYGTDLTGWGLGVVFVGDKGMLAADYGRRMLLPESKFKGFEPPKQTIARSVGHHREWLNAVKHGTPTTCNFRYSGALSESVLLGTVAFRTGQKLDWDGANLKATNCRAAEEFLRKEYRAGWSPFV